MDPVTLVVAALVAGASAGVTSAASTAVTDAYAALRAGVRRLVGRKDGVVAALDRGDEPQPPEVLEAELVEELAGVDFGADSEVMALAQRLLSLVDAAGSAAGKFSVDAREAKGVQVGDSNSQRNTFN